jgi:uncharacterized glyoxalase superfamily protein PhnB
MSDPQRSVVCGHRYRNAPAAIQWLCDVLGFQRQAVYPGPNDTVAHAQLTFGGAMIFIGSMNDNESQRFLKQPDEIGGAETRHVYLMVPDADLVYARVKSSGAELVIDIKDESYGGRGFTCRDPEGHIWNIGTHNPWKTT